MKASSGGTWLFRKIKFVIITLPGNAPAQNLRVAIKKAKKELVMIFATDANGRSFTIMLHDSVMPNNHFFRSTLVRNAPVCIKTPSP